MIDCHKLLITGDLMDLSSKKMNECFNNSLLFKFKIIVIHLKLFSLNQLIKML